MEIKLQDVYNLARARALYGEYDVTAMVDRLAPVGGSGKDVLNRFVDIYPELIGKYGHRECVKLLMQEMLDILIEAYTLEASQAIYDVRNKKGDE